MLAVRNHGIRDVRVDQVPDPVVVPGKVLVKVAYAGICGSDLHIYRKGMFVTYLHETMGHEFSGTVEAVGPGVTGFRRGDKVVGDPRVGCGSCSWCLQGDYNLCPGLGFIGEVSPGCFAEYILMDPQKLLLVPPHIDLRRAALVEPMAVALHILDQAVITGETSMGIIGAGPIGLLTMMAAKQAKAGRITVLDISKSRLDTAQKLGADQTLTAFPDDPAEAVDLAVEAVGSEQALNGALQWLKPVGRLVMVALYEKEVKIDPNYIVTKELRLVGVDAYRTANLQQAIAFLANCPAEIEQVISHVMPFTQAEQAFQLLTTPGAACSKILLTSDGEFVM
jgi:threonine dehydrogenase-like Zn-dependent dehydrogenase